MMTGNCVSQIKYFLLQNNFFLLLTAIVIAIINLQPA